MEFLIKTDKNGTKFYGDNTCCRCGGQGARSEWAWTGSICYECGGTGVSKTRISKVYTPEYRAILDAKYQAKEAKRVAKYEADMIASAQTKNEDFFMKYLGAGEFIFVIKGETYSIKDTLKAEGCKFAMGLGWYSLKTVREAYAVKMSDIVKFDRFGIVGFKDATELEAVLKSAKALVEASSSHQGTVGERKTWNLKVESAISFEVRAFGSYYDRYETMYINKMVDDNGNVFIWKTGKGLPIGAISLVGTVKEHGEYNGVNQTILTRCKVVE